MGLLSRKKTIASPPAILSISSPLQSNSIFPPTPATTHDGMYSNGSNVYGEMTQVRDSFEDQSRPSMESSAVSYGGALPSPPGSPISAAGRTYPIRNTTNQTYTSASHPRPQQNHYSNNGASTNAYATSTSTSSPLNGSPDRRELINTSTPSPSRNIVDRLSEPSHASPSSFSSELSNNTSNMLYNEHSPARSSATGASDEPGVEGKMGSLDLQSSSAAHLHSHRADDNMSVQSDDMEGIHFARVGVPSTPVLQQIPSAIPVSIMRPVSAVSTANSSILSPTPSTNSSQARKTSSRYNLADFTFIRTLGTGSFGRVHLVRSQHNSRSYAVKVLSKDRVVKMKQVEHTNSEREMLERVRHPFLVNLWGTFKDSKNLYMVMDFVAGGELFSLLRKSQRFPDPVAKFFAAEVALALDYLHSLDIIYRDLKPENILLGADGHVKITDFGFAKHVPDITWTLCGTPDYLAPEIVQSRGYNKSVDWYALGVLVFEMLAGYPPFFTEDANPMRLYEKIIAGKVRYPAYFFPEAKDLLKSLLTPDITKRFGNLANGSRDIFGHVWFQEVDWERLYRKEIPAPYVPKVEGDWDASNFDQYPEVDMSEYGSTGPDPHGHHFPSF